MSISMDPFCKNVRIEDEIYELRNEKEEGRERKERRKSRSVKLKNCNTLWMQAVQYWGVVLCRETK